MLYYVEEENVTATYYFEMTTLVRTILWALEGTAKMERRIIDELDADICRLIVFTILVR
jgi:hypothetical protein